MIVSGPSGSGKTTFVIQMINNIGIFDEKPQRVVWCYGATPPPFQIGNFKIISKDGLPLEEDLQTLDLVIIDDLMEEGNISQLFTRVAHHKHCFIVYITQNLYSKKSRTININTNYLVLFKNPRDQSQIHHIGRQMFPGKSQFLIDAFKDATSRAFNCLFIDLKQQTPDKIRVRSSPFNKPINIYLPK